MQRISDIVAEFQWFLRWCLIAFFGSGSGSSVPSRDFCYISGWNGSALVTLATNVCVLKGFQMYSRVHQESQRISARDNTRFSMGESGFLKGSVRVETLSARDEVQCVVFRET